MTIDIPSVLNHFICTPYYTTGKIPQLSDILYPNGDGSAIGNQYISIDKTEIVLHGVRGDYIISLNSEHFFVLVGFEFILYIEDIKEIENEEDFFNQSLMIDMKGFTFELLTKIRELQKTLYANNKAYMDSVYVS